MPRTFIVVIAVLLLAAAASGDMRVIGTLRFEPNPQWGRMATDLTLTREWWFGLNVMALVTEEWRYVFDKSRARVLVINVKDKYVVAAPMTAGARDLVEPGSLDALGRTQVNGTLTKSPKKRTILGKECPGTVVSEWIATDNRHVFDRDRTIYASPDVPFDWRMNRDLTMWMVSFFNPQMAYFGELRSVEGFPLVETDVFTRNNQRMIYSTEVTEMRDATPAPDLYEIPEGFTRKEKLSQRDILAMRQLLYFIYFY
ncbi:MAG: hypothetical protein ABSG19_13505 [Candidatus Aminicenantales bacterium]